MHLDSLTTFARLSPSKNAPTALGAAARAPGIALSLLDVSQRVGLAPAPLGSWLFLNVLPGDREGVHGRRRSGTSEEHR